MTARVRVIVSSVVLLTLFVVTVATPATWQPEFTQRTLLIALTLGLLILISDFIDVDLPISSVHVTISISSALCFAGALILGPSLGALVAGISGTAGEVIGRRHPLKAATNVSTYVLATFLSGWLYTSLAQIELTPIGSLSNMAILLLAAATYTATEGVVMSIILSQVMRTTPWVVWRASFAGVLFESITLPTLGSLIVVLRDENPLALVFAVLPLLGPYLAFRGYHKINQETRRAIELLADMLDRRDPYTFEHSARVAALAEEILLELGDIATEEIELIVGAARIHDLGKVGTSDATLHKPGKLTEEERRAFERHASDGAAILQHLAQYQEAAIIVRHHHERWDGRGYPSGLAGEEIPFGSRVIAVADTYDAMTSDRSYRRALPHAVAMAEIRRCAGTQFDPRIVAAFERAMGKAPVASAAPVLEPARAE